MSYWFLDPITRTLGFAIGSSAMRGLSSIFVSPKIIAGPRALPQFAEIVSALCQKKKAYVVTDKHVDKLAERVASVMEKNGFLVETWNKAEPEPSLENVNECAQSMKKFEPDLIIAVGGGSVIDCSKLAWILYERPDITDLTAISPLTITSVTPVTVELTLLGLRKKAILAAVPTTSGTGSDATSIAVATDAKVGRKIPVVLNELIPDFSVLIPAFPMGMPPKLTVGTGLDALAHAFDAVMSQWATDITDALALRSIQLVFKYLPRAYRNPRDLEARHRMHIAATMAGLAFCNGGVGLTHSLGHSLGKVFSIHHGVAVGIFIPYALQYYSKVTDKYLEICKALEIEARTKKEYLAMLVKRVRALISELDVPLTLKDLGISEEDFKENFERLVRYAYEDPSNFQNPRPITMEEYEKFCRYAYTGRDIDF